MSTTQILNEMQTEIEAIRAMKPTTREELQAWWIRLGEWWHRRELHFGDGSGSKSHCFAMARKYE